MIDQGPLLCAVAPVVGLVELVTVVFLRLKAFLGSRREGLLSAVGRGRRVRGGRCWGITQGNRLTIRPVLLARRALLVCGRPRLL